MNKPADTRERGLEDLIVAALVSAPGSGDGASGTGERSAQPTALCGGGGWLLGDWRDYDREHCVDLKQLRAFLDAATALALEEDGPTRRKFLARLQGEISKGGTIDLLRHGVKDGAHHALDLALFINGLPVTTFELKNRLTKQTVAASSTSRSMTRRFASAPTSGVMRPGFYRFLAEETDPNQLHDLKAELDAAQVCSEAQVAELVELYLGDADRDRLDPILDACVAVYKEQLDGDGQLEFKGRAKAFVRTYSFLASILPYTQAGWEKLSTFLNFLVPKLPAPVEQDLSKGILESIDMDSYRAEKKAAQRIQLPDDDALIDPVPIGGGGGKPEPELDRLSNIVKTFNDQFGNIPWSDADRVHDVITQQIPDRVAADAASRMRAATPTSRTRASSTTGRWRV
jgi:hypothetical protein